MPTFGDGCRIGILFRLNLDAAFQAAFLWVQKHVGFANIWFASQTSDSGVDALDAFCGRI
jgi:hypothetical protein